MTNPITPFRLAEIEERCEAATYGPWYAINIVVGDGGSRTGIYSNRNASNSIAYCFRFSDDIVPNASFIAHARQDLPDCHAEIKRLQDRIAEIGLERDIALGELEAK